MDVLGLTDLSFLHNWSVSNGAYVDDMFSKCKNLRRVGISGGPVKSLFLNPSSGARVFVYRV